MVVKKTCWILFQRLKIERDNEHHKNDDAHNFGLNVLFPTVVAAEVFLSSAIMIAIRRLRSGSVGQPHFDCSQRVTFVGAFTHNRICRILASAHVRPQWARAGLSWKLHVRIIQLDAFSTLSFPPQ